VSERAFQKKNESISFNKETLKPIWGFGYRHMCNFWLNDFWHYVCGYTKIIRIVLLLTMGKRFTSWSVEDMLLYN